MSVAYLGGGKLSLGELKSQWSTNQWTSTCTHCSGKVYICAIGGLPLSGRGSATGICTQCEEYVSVKPFSKYFGQYMETVYKKDSLFFITS